LPTRAASCYNVAVVAILLALLAQDPGGVTLEADRPVLVRGVRCTVTVRVAAGWSGAVRVTGLRDRTTAQVRNGRAVLAGVVPDGDVVVADARLRTIPGWLGLLPFVVAIALALVLRRPLVPLVAGAWVAMFIVAGLAWHAPFTAAARIVDPLVLDVLQARGLAAAVIAIVLVGGLVGLLSGSGGTKGVVDKLGRSITSPRQAMLVVWAAGVILSIKDVAAALLVGGALRPLTDRVRVSREKLAYLVDSTVAPMAVIGLLSTWPYVEMLVLNPGDPGAVYGTFLLLVPYGAYAFFAVLLAALVAASGRDFGPMLAAESRAASSGLPVRIGGRPLAERDSAELDEYEDMRARWANVAVPIAAVLAVTAVTLLLDGGRAPERVVAGGLLAGALAAVLISVGRKHLDLPQALDAWMAGARSMALPAVVLVLAFALAQGSRMLSTGEWLWSVMTSAAATKWTPALVFGAGALLGFATGSVWATLAVLLPSVVSTVPGDDPLRYASLAAAMSGSVFGRHLSPIGDMTLVASVGGASDPHDHVKTQAPYALLCGVAALACGCIPAGFRVSPWLSILVGGGVVAGVFFALAKPRSERWTGWAAPAPPPSISAPTEVPLPEEQTMS